MKKARYPTDPNRAWMAFPNGSPIYARRFTAWADAYAYAYARTH